MLLSGTVKRYDIKALWHSAHGMSCFIGQICVIKEQFHLFLSYYSGEAGDLTLRAPITI